MAKEPIPSNRPVNFSGTGNVTYTRKLINTAQPSESLLLRWGEREEKSHTEPTNIIINLNTRPQANAQRHNNIRLIRTPRASFLWKNHVLVVRIIIMHYEQVSLFHNFTNNIFRNHLNRSQPLQMSRLISLVSRAYGDSRWIFHSC